MSDGEDRPFLSTFAHHGTDPFRLLVESVVDYAIFMVDPAGAVASWNPGAERVYGWRAEEIIGRPYDVLAPDGTDTDGPRSPDGRRALDGGSHEEVVERVRRDGERFWAVVTTSILKDHFGREAGFSVVTRDITERVRAEAAVRRERDVSTAILASLPGVYYMYDEAGRFLRWNRRFEEVTGYRADQIAALHPLDLFEGDDRRRVAERIEEVFRSGESEIEATFVSRSGTRTPFHFNGVRAVIEGQRCLLGMGIDISESRRAQEALRVADERLRLTASAAGVGLWDWDLATDRVFYSPEWKRQIGYADHEIGEHLDEWRSRVHPDDLDAAMRRMLTFVDNPTERYDAQFRLRHRDGSYRWILSQASLLHDVEGRPIRMLGWHVDITAPRELEHQLQHAAKLEAVGQLAGGLAHDFNNFLTVINGNADLLIDDLPTDAPARELLVEIRRSGASAATLTQRLLTFSRQQPLAPAPLDLNGLLADLEPILRRLVGSRVELVVAPAPALGAVHADRAQLEQVVVNLVVNARDAMPDGGRVVVATAEVAEVDAPTSAEGWPMGPAVALLVTDTGVGIDTADVPRIFEPFFTTKPVEAGTGLGLATVHGIVAQSRGHIAVTSERGRGTTFTVHLPLAATSADVGAGPTADEAAAVAVPSGPAPD
jgi:PAS domain S-box-containing protein